MEKMEEVLMTKKELSEYLSNCGFLNVLSVKIGTFRSAKTSET